VVDEETAVEVAVGNHIVDAADLLVKADEMSSSLVAVVQLDADTLARVCSVDCLFFLTTAVDLRVRPRPQKKGYPLRRGKLLCCVSDLNSQNAGFHSYND